MSVGKGIGLLLAAAATGVAAGAIVLPGESAEVMQNRDRIAKLSPGDRARLDQKFQGYQALDPEGRARLKSLHAALAEDRLSKNGLHNNLMNDYVAWVSTIPATRREDLLSRTDPAERVVAMRRLLDERQARALNDGDIAEISGPPRLSRPEVVEVMKVVEEHVRPTLSLDEIQVLEGLKSPLRDAFLATRLSAQIQGPQPPQAIWSQGMLDQMAEQVRMEGIREFMQEASRRSGGRMRGVVIVNMLLMTAVHQDLRRELATRKIGDDQLEAHFLTLSADDQDALTRLSADDFRSALRISFLGKDEAVVREFGTEFRRFTALFQRLGMLGRRPEGGGPRPDGPRPDGPRPEGGRPEGFRPGEGGRPRGEPGPPFPRGDGPGRDRDRPRPEEETR